MAIIQHLSLIACASRIRRGSCGGCRGVQEKRVKIVWIDRGWVQVHRGKARHWHVGVLVADHAVVAVQQTGKYRRPENLSGWSAHARGRIRRRPLAVLLITRRTLERIACGRLRSSLIVPERIASGIR